MTDYDCVECPTVGGFPPTRYEVQVRQRGNYIVAVFKMWIEGWGDIVVRARVSIRQIQQILFRKYKGQIAGYDPYTMEGFFDSIVKGAKDIAKKVARSKVFKAARKIISHPAVLAVSQVIPGLNAVIPAAAMISKGLDMASALSKARRGSKPDMHTIKKAIKIAKKGKGKKAIRAAKLLRIADKMVITPPIAKQVAPAAAAIAKRTGVPTTAIQRAIVTAVKTDVPKPPPVAKPRRRRKPTVMQRRRLMRQKKRFLRRQKKARQYFLKTGRWPRGFDPRAKMMPRRPRRPRMPGLPPGMPPMAPPPRYLPIQQPPGRAPWYPSYPQYY